MRKFYSIIVVMVAALAAFSSQAKTLTLKASANDAVYFVDTENNGLTTPITTAGISCSFNNEGTLVIKSNTGWLITKVAQAGGGASFDYSGGTTDTSERGLATAAFTDGSTVEITVSQGSVSKPMLHITGTAGQYYVNYNYSEYQPDASGNIDIENGQATLSIYAKDGYRLSSVTANGNTIGVQGGGTYASFYTGSYSGDVAVEVITKALADIETGKFTVKINGAAYKVNMYDANYNYTYFSEASTEVTFEEGASYTFSSSYGQLYSLKVNGDLKATAWTSYSYVPADGDVVEIDTEYPDINVPVNFSFTGTADAGVVKEFRYDYNLLDASVWNSNWNGKMGKSVSMVLNTSDYQNVSMKVNGTEMTPDYYGNISLTLTESSYDIVIYGERTEPYKVTIVVEDPSWINIFKGYTSETFTLTGQETELTVARSENALKFAGADGYIINGITVNGVAPADNEFYNNMYYVNDDCVIEVDVEKINRDKIAVVYLENRNWEYKSFVLSQSNYDLRKEVEIANGYNFVEYGDFDIPFSISGYPQPTVYLNDEEIESIYGSYPALSEYKEGDVIKMYGSSQTPYELNYTIADNAKVTVMHDHLTEVANPANHNVLPGTQVHIIPVATFANESSNTIDVTVNDVKLNPDADGRYSFVVNANTNVDVKNGSSGIENVEIDNNAANQAVYNLQGIKVADSLKDLPAGLYIQSGKKVLVK